MIQLALFALFAGPADAQAWKSYVKSSPPRAAAACRQVRPVHAGGTQGYADQLGSGQCFVSVSPVHSQGLVYRNYAVFGDGMLMAFNSFGDSEDTAKDTGAREFHFFPRLGSLELLIDPSVPAVAVRMADGGLLTFDPATAQPRAVDRGSVTVAPAVDRGNRGGVEFPAYSGLMLDSGFRMGELPSMRPEAESVFRDANGRTCAVKNREVFTHANGDRTFKFDDAGLKAFLKSRCPGLSVLY